MDIREAIQERTKQIKRLQQEIATLEDAATLLEGTPKADKTQSQSQPDMAASVMEEAGKPMHVMQIAEQIKRRFGVTIKKANLGVLLFRYSKRGSRFYKVKGKPNTYGLMRWQTPNEVAENAKQSAA